MKKNQLIVSVFSLAILFSSCSRQYDLQFAGHYKPNTTSVTKEKTSIVSSRNDEMQPLSVPSSGVTASVSSDYSPTDLKKLNQVKQNTSAVTALNDKQQRKMETVTKKIENQIEKNKAKIEKLQKQSSNLNSNQSSIQKLTDDNKVLYAILGFLIPPLGVGLYEDGITVHFWIALVLMLCFWLPGAIYALIIILG